MHFTAKTIPEFLDHWSDTRNFLLGPELISFDLDLPPTEEIVDILRKDTDSRVQFLGVEDEAEKEGLVQKFKTRPLEAVIDQPFSLANFHLQNFYGAGAFLQGFQRHVMVPWRTFLSSTGLTWQRCYPIIFISGKGCSSTYHVDVSHVVAWQVHGQKVFNGFKDPSEYGPIQHVVDNRQEYLVPSPPEVDPDDVLTYRMEPGDILWNQLLTPHWVTAGNEIAVSVNISHGGISHQGEFCPNEQVLRKRWDEHPKEAWTFDQRY